MCFHIRTSEKEAKIMSACLKDKNLKWDDNDDDLNNRKEE